MSTRRAFVELASAAMFVGGRMRRIPREGPAPIDRYPRAGDPRIQELAARALEAAKAAGATYAEVRFTLTETEDVSGDGLYHYSSKRGNVGVRAMAGGAWGFTSSTLWTAEEMARLGGEAALQGQANAFGRRRKIEWTPRPAVTGTWVAPVQVDPFTVPLAEKMAVLAAMSDRMLEPFKRRASLIDTKGGMSCRTWRQESTFASTEGSFLTQTRYAVSPTMGSMVFDGQVSVFRGLPRMQPRAAGWEVMTDPALYDEVAPLFEENRSMLDAEAPDPGRYDIVCDATIMAQLLAQTVGVATELDRALGYEANAGGTSYLSPPEEVLGRYALGPALLNVTASRSIPGMLATAKWDDEGSETQDYPLITNGVVVDYHTNRELAPTLASWDTRQGRAVRSRGCATAAHAGYAPIVQPPNLIMAPAATDVRFDELVAGLDHGIVLIGGTSPTNTESRLSAHVLTTAPNNILWPPSRFFGTVTVDRQQLNGEIDGGNSGFAYEVRQGKRVRSLRRLEVLFRAPDLWKNLQAIGGASTQMDGGYRTWKGEPAQESVFTVRACAARFKQVAVTDKVRKA